MKEMVNTNINFKVWNRKISRLSTPLLFMNHNLSLMIKLGITLVVLLLLSGCRSKEAHNFRDQVDSSQQRIYRLIHSSAEDKRLNAMIANKPEIALRIGLAQRRQLQRLMEDFNLIEVKDIPEGLSLKRSTINLNNLFLTEKDLHIRESELMFITLGKDKTEARKATHDLDSLIRKQIALNDYIIKSVKEWNTVRMKFLRANKLN